jgi:hypothetical protein
MRTNEPSTQELEPLEWDQPVIQVRSARVEAVAQAASAPITRTVRDRYVAARFPGRFRAAGELADVEPVIDAARAYFDAAKTDRSIELLDLSILVAPANEAVHLARLEILFLVRDAALFSRCARELSERHPQSKAWSEVARLGRAIAPADELFGARQGPRLYEHYGPWPHLPNWIGASWDLSSEVLAAELHAALAQEAARETENLQQAA